MNRREDQASTDARPATTGRARGLLVAVALSVVFLAVTAWQAIAVMQLMLDSSEVMRAASANLVTGEIGLEVLGFVVAQVLLHVGFGMAVWLLALATASLWPAARQQVIGLVTLWFCLLASAVLAYNATWFPRTGSGEYYHDLAMQPVGTLFAGQVIYGTAVALGLVVLAAALFKWLRRMSAHPRSRRGLIGGAAVAVLALVSLWTSDLVSAERGQGASVRPNVIFLGVDSLRLAELRRFGGSGHTRNIDEFIASADLVTDATTPVARTYPSWVAILTGRSPRATGAIFNLMERDTIAVNPTIADVLRGAGYRTVYATDEVRFANIDQTYGFDQAVTPRIGAADFLLGKFNDLPLVTVVANSRLGRALFPYSHANRGAATLFQPRTFLARLDREIEFDGPTFLAIHLTAAHWPYYVSDTPLDADSRVHENDRPLYDSGLATADDMFGSVVHMLRRKGALEHAIVVVLSDHGEGLALPGDSLIDATDPRVTGLQVPPPLMNWGHGQSVLSPVQYQVLLSFQTFGNIGDYRSNARMVSAPGTVEDIAPTILDLIGVPAAKLHATGVSLGPVLRGDDAEAERRFASRVRFTETDLRVMPGADGNADEQETARQNSIYFQVDTDTGRLHLRRRSIPLLMSMKERAAFDDRLVLACLPADPDSHQYLLLDRRTGAGRLLSAEPRVEDAEARRLWDALAANFAGELKPPATIRPEDVPIIARAWSAFIASQQPALRASNAPGQR